MCEKGIIIVCIRFMYMFYYQALYLHFWLMIVHLSYVAVFLLLEFIKINTNST